MGIAPSFDSAEDLADEIWQVRLPNGSVEAMSIEEVESAFTRGELDLGTKVQRPSGGEWVSIAEAAGMAGDSITPMTVATDIHAPNIPRPAPLPLSEDDSPLSAAELYSVTPRGGFSNLIGVAGAAALLIGGFVAWHYLPAHPIPSLATTTIMAPPETAVAAVAPPPAITAEPQVAPSPETSPAPEGNALTDAKIASAPPAAPAKKAVPAVNKTKKKTTLKKPESATTFTIHKHAVVKSQ